MPSQVTINKRYSHGLASNANYTFSKNLDLLSSPDIFNRQLGKRLSGNDLPHQLRLTAEYQVPNLKDSNLPVLSNTVVSYLLGNWGIGWYMQYQSGGALGRPGSVSTAPISQYLGRGSASAQLKIGPDGKLMNPWSVNWTDLDGNLRTDPIDINCRCFEPTCAPTVISANQTRTLT